MKCVLVGCIVDVVELQSTGDDDMKDVFDLDAPTVKRLELWIVPRLRLLRHYTLNF